MKKQTGWKKVLRICSPKRKAFWSGKGMKRKGRWRRLEEVRRRRRRTSEIFDETTRRATVENEWYHERLVAELRGATWRTDPSWADKQQRRLRRFTEVCNFADASWLTWLESERRGRSERRSLPALEELLKSAYRLSCSFCFFFPFFSLFSPFVSFFSSLFLSLSRSSTPLLFSVSLHFGTLEFRSYFGSSCPRFLVHPLSFLPSVLFLSFYRRMARLRPDLRAYAKAKAKDGVYRKETVDILLSLSLSLPYRVLSSTRRTEVEDGGSEKETDKRRYWS